MGTPSNHTKQFNPLISHFVNTVKVGLRHPDPVVETSSLSSVNPPDVWYRVSIPEEVIDRGCLSALQLEAITYAAQVKIYMNKLNPKIRFKKENFMNYAASIYE